MQASHLACAPLAAIARRDMPQNAKHEVAYRRRVMNIRFSCCTRRCPPARYAWGQ